MAHFTVECLSLCQPF